MPVATLNTLVGLIAIAEQDGAVTRVRWTDKSARDESPLLNEAIAQLEAYFAGERREFDLPLRVAGGDFQR